MQRLFALALACSVLSVPAHSDNCRDHPLRSPGCAGGTLVGPSDALAGSERGAIQLAQSDCRGRCGSTRGYCMSTCRDSFCRAVCNDQYQSCLSSCR